MPTTLPPEFTTQTFELNSTDEQDNSPDLWIEETFIDGYGTERAVLDGDTYEAKEIIKFDWNTTHHDFDGNRKAWIVDVESLPVLAEKLEDAGYEVAFENPNEPDTDGPMFDLHDFAEEGDTIEVEYEMKNGNGTNTKSGKILDVTFNSGYEDKPQINFRRDDGQFMYIQFDTSRSVSLYTGGSHAPFVGNAVSATVEK